MILSEKSLILCSDITLSSTFLKEELNFYLKSSILTRKWIDSYGNFYKVPHPHISR